VFDGLVPFNSVKTLGHYLSLKPKSKTTLWS